MADDVTGVEWPTVDGLADDVPPSATDLVVCRACAGTGLGMQPQRRTLTGFLHGIRDPQAPGEAGGVPVPDWPRFRAVLGGASRDDLEASHMAPSRGVRDAERRHAKQRVEAAAQHGGHLPAGLHIVRGQTGVGKSAFVVNLAHAAALAGHPVLYVSLEHDGAEIAARFLSLASGIPWHTLALRKRLEAEADAQRRAGEQLLATQGIPERVAVLVTDTFDASSLQREAMGLFDAFRRVPLVVFDDLRMATVRGFDGHLAPMDEAVAEVVAGLRALSRRFEHRPDWPGCPVVLLETLNAVPEEAGAMEATAATAWVIGLGDSDSDTGAQALTLRLVKNRFGMPGQRIPFTFRGATGLLEEAPDGHALIPPEAAAPKVTKRRRPSHP